MPRQRIDQLKAMLGVVKHHHRLFAAGCPVGTEQYAKFAEQGVGGRQGVSGSAGRTGGGALAAAGTDLRIDRHMIAIWRYGAGRTEIETAAAADNLGTRMRAQILGERNVARLVECADEIARLEYRAQDGGGIARIGAQVSVAQIGGWEQRRAARKVNDNVAARRRAIARRSKGELAARGRVGRGIIVHRQLKGAKIAFGRADVALHYREVGHRLRRQAAGRLDQHRHVEMLFQQIGGFDRLLVLAVNERHALAGQRHEGDVRHRLQTGGDQGCHFWAGFLGILRPAGGLADIDEGQLGRTLDGLGNLVEQRSFLRAGHGDRRAASRQFTKAF